MPKMASVPKVLGVGESCLVSTHGCGWVSRWSEVACERAWIKKIKFMEENIVDNYYNYENNIEDNMYMHGNVCARVS